MDAKRLRFLGMENIGHPPFELVAGINSNQGTGTSFYYTENHVLYGKLRPYLKKVYLPNLPGRCSTELVPLLPNDNMDREYLGFLLLSDQITNYVMSEVTGSRMPRADIKKLLKYKISCPSLPEQRAIVAALKSKLDAIASIEEKTRKQMTELEAWYRNVCVEKIKQYPVTEKKLGEIADFEYGYTASGGIHGTERFIRITDIDGNGFLKQNPQVFIDYPQSLTAERLQMGDILVARTGGTFGKTMIFTEQYPAVFASFLIRIKFKINILEKFYWYFSQTKLYWDQANKLVRRGTQPQFNANALAKVVMTYPSKEYQKKIVDEMDNIVMHYRTVNEKLSQQLKNLSTLRNALYQEAFGGDGE